MKVTVGKMKRFRMVASMLVAISFIINTGINIPKVEAKTTNQPIQQFANVVLFAHFSGDEAESDAQFFVEHRDEIIGYYDGTQGRSLKNYMSTISYGKFQVTNIFPQDDGDKIVSYQLPFTEEDAENGNIDAQIISELISHVPGIENQIVDYDGDGAIDNLTVILKAGENANSQISVYAHMSTYAGNEQWSNKLIRNYNFLNTYRLMEVLVPEESGMIAHEFLHSLGYSDLYNNDSDYPVYTWDIMASSSRYLCYPLAYTRMKVSGWLDIDTITSSQTLTLDTQSNAEGNQAYILQSPLNTNEIFVVEYRKKDTSDAYGNNTIDAKIGGSGIIVYRVDLTVDNMSNYHGKTAIYIFRPQEGQSGYNTLASICVQNAYLSEESGRTSIGSSDMSKTLEEGALTFSDGSNSGIVISNVSSSEGSQMTFDVTIPNAADLDGWTDTQFNDTVDDQYAGKNVTVASTATEQVMMAYENGVATSYSYDGSQWKQKGNSFSCSGAPVDMQLLYHKGEWYFAYIDNICSKLELLCYNKTSQNWQSVISISNPGAEFDITSVDDNIYLVYIMDSMNANLLKWDGNVLSALGSYSSNALCGQPRISSVSGTIYVSTRLALGNEIKVFRYNNGFNEITNYNISANTYDMLGMDDKLYIVSGGEALAVYEYSNGIWVNSVQGTISCFEPVLASVNDCLYILTTPITGEGNTKVYLYDSDNKTFIQEGLNIDGYGQDLSMTSISNGLMVGYVQKLNNRIVVKTKEVNNSQKEQETPSKGNDSSQEVTPPQNDTQPKEVPNIVVSYRTHVQDYGWQNYVKNGTTSGTYGQSKRLEAINIQVSGNSNVGIQYSTHVQDYGWLPWAADNDMSGTEGESKRLEAIMIQLTGSEAQYYDVYYRVHAQDYGWLDWAKNGEPAGTAALSKRLEAIQIVVVRKGEGQGYNTSLPYISGNGSRVYVAGVDAPSVKYRTHVQDYGWQGYQYNGAISGTTGQSKRLEGINLYLNNRPYEGGIRYQTHVQDYGWQGWSYNGAMSGTSGQSKRLEAIRIELTGEMANHYDVYYRVHAQDYGWLDWAKNGQSAGTAGLSKRLEGIQVLVVPKGSVPPGNMNVPFIQG